MAKRYRWTERQNLLALFGSIQHAFELTIIYLRGFWLALRRGKREPIKVSSHGDTLMSQIQLVSTGQEELEVSLQTQLNLAAPPGPYAWSLFSTNVVPSFNTVAADVPVETLNAVGSKGVTTFGAPYLTPEGQWEISSPTVLQWVAAIADLGKTIYGYAVMDVTGILLFAERFDTPVVISTVGQAVQVFPRVQLPSLAGTGAVED
jgi:hypothetical protein